MLRPMGLICAGGLLVAVAGCAFMVGDTAVQVGVKVNEQVVNDSLDRVAQRIENEMRRLGLEVTASPDRDAIRLTSKTKAGQTFVVVLNRTKGPQGEQTRVHVDWEQETDKELWLQLLLVGAQTAVSSK